MNECHNLVSQNREDRGAGARIIKQKYNPDYVVPGQSQVDYKTLFSDHDDEDTELEEVKDKVDYDDIQARIDKLKQNL